MINLTIEYISGQNEVPEGLQDTIKPDLEWRKGIINHQFIVSIYPNADNSGTLIQTTMDFIYLVKESVPEIEKRIEEANKFII